MEVQVFRTPKIIVNKSKKNPLLRQNESPIKLKRRLSLANSRTNLFKNNDLVTKRCENSKKPIINILPKESNQKEVKNNNINIYKKIEAKSGKINRINEIHNNFFINLTKNIYTNESHLKKKIVRNSQKFLQSSKNKFAIDKNPNINGINNSKKGLFNRRLSCIILPSSFEKKRRNIDNKNLEKEAVTEYSNFKSSKRQKYNENISKLLLNKNLTKKEKEFMLDYLNNIKEKDLDSSPKFKLEDRRSISPRKKKSKKKNNVKFNDKHSHLKKEKEVNDKNEKLEKEITEKELTENNINNKIIIQNKNPNFLKMICFKPFFCCLKMNK